MRLSSPFLRTALALGLTFALAACSADRSAKDGAAQAPEVAETTEAATFSEANINSSAQKLFGGEPPILVRESPIQGLYEIHMSNGVFYSSPDGKYFMQGDMIEVDTMQSMTQEARNESEGQRGAARAEALEAYLASGGEDTAITYEAKDAEYELYVFTDITCPYCTQFHEEMDAHLKAGITIHYLAWPRSGPESETADVMANAWCAKDPKKALDSLFDGKEVPEVDCDSPVTDHFQLGRDMMVSGTPAVFTSDGTQFGGYMPHENLIQALRAEYEKTED